MKRQKKPTTKKYRQIVDEIRLRKYINKMNCLLDQAKQNGVHLTVTGGKRSAYRIKAELRKE